MIIFKMPVPPEPDMVEVGGIAPPSGHGSEQISTIIVQLLISPLQLRGTGYTGGYSGK